MPNVLEGKRIAILATDGFEQAELIEPKRALQAAGAITTVVSLRLGQIRGWNEGDWGDPLLVDVTVDSVSPDSFDALLLPGGVMNPDRLRLSVHAVRFVRAFFSAGKPVGAICHAPWLLIEAEVVRGRRLTSWPSLRQDLINAGAQWSDSEVVTDAGLVTSRMPGDLPSFIHKLIEEVAEGPHRKGGEKAEASLP